MDAEEILECLRPRLPACDIWMLGKVDSSGEQTHWHIVTDLVLKWRQVKARVRELAQALGAGVRVERRLASGIDLGILNGPPHLRAPRSWKVFGEIDPDGYYRVVACWRRGGRFDKIEDGFQADLTREAFIGGGALAAATFVPVAWTAAERVLNVPDFLAVMPFHYDAYIASWEELDTLVKGWLRDAGVEDRKLEPGEWAELQEVVVKYLNRYMAHARDGGIFVVAEPHNYSPNWDPNYTVVLPRNTLLNFAREDVFHAAYASFWHNLHTPDKKRPGRVLWTRVWLTHPSSRVYNTSYGFSKPLVRPPGVDGPPPSVMNTWTGPGIMPQAAFAAVSDNPARAIEVVEFFIDFLKNVVAGDPFEDPIYNNFVFQSVVHLLVWTLKRPHDIFPCITYLWSPEQGVGKGQLANVLTALAGVTNVHSGVGVNGMSGNFGGYIADKVLWVMDEESSRQKEQEANGMIKHVATDPLLTADRKYQAYRTVNNVLTILVLSNMLRSLSLADRRWMSAAMSSAKRGHSEYWVKFVDLIYLNRGMEYIAAWLYGIDPHPDFKPGMQIPKGYLRVRQAERETTLDPLLAVLMPWFATATRIETEHRVPTFRGEFVEWMDLTEETFQVDKFESEMTAPTRLFIEDWLSGGPPHARHYNQSMMAGMAIDKKVLVEQCAATKLSRSYTVHNLKRSLMEVFGEKNAVLFANDQQGWLTYTSLAAEDCFVERVMAYMASKLDQARGDAIGCPVHWPENAWPIPVARLREFALHGVKVEQGNGVVTYGVYKYLNDFGDDSLPPVLIWPHAESARAKCFENAGGGRTPVEEIPNYPVNLWWFRAGFPTLKGHKSREVAEVFVGENQLSPQARAARNREVAEAEAEFQRMLQTL